MFNFEWPLVALLLPLPFIVRYLFEPKKQLSDDKAPEIHFPHVQSLKSAFGIESAIASKKNSRWPWLLYLAWALFVIALMRPQIIDQVFSQETKGRDLMMAVDLSGSMQSLDFATESDRANRLDVAKRVVKDFVKKRPKDRIGLIVFGEHAYLQSPLTMDHSAVSHMLENTVPGVAGDATAIGDAVGLAVKNLRERPALSRAIILLTDGEDNASTIPPLQAAKLAKQYGIHIYSIVIGKDGPVPFPDGYGGYAMYDSHVDTDLTKKMAEMTGGEFYRATDADALARIYERINSLQTSSAVRPPSLIRKPLFQYPLGLALIVIGILGTAAQLKGGSHEFSWV